VLLLLCLDQSCQMNFSLYRAASVRSLQKHCSFFHCANQRVLAIAFYPAIHVVCIVKNGMGMCFPRFIERNRFHMRHFCKRSHIIAVQIANGFCTTHPSSNLAQSPPGNSCLYRLLLLLLFTELLPLLLRLQHQEKNGDLLWNL
jgi:hypothetical protein